MPKNDKTCGSIIVDYYTFPDFGRNISINLQAVLKAPCLTGNECSKAFLLTLDLELQNPMDGKNYKLLFKSPDCRIRMPARVDQGKKRALFGRRCWTLLRLGTMLDQCTNRQLLLEPMAHGLSASYMNEFYQKLSHQSLHQKTPRRY